MRPIRTTKTARLRRLEMYREDMDAFVALFRDHCANVTISDGKNQYESLDEMENHAGSEVKELDIRGEAPGVHFLLDHKEVVQGSSTASIFNELRTEEITDEADSLFFRIKDFLEERQRPVLRPVFLALALIAPIGVFTNLPLRDASGLRPWLFVGSFALLVGSLIGTVWLTNRITLQKRSLRLSFWKRNKNEIWLRIIGAAASGVIGFLLGRLSK